MDFDEHLVCQGLADRTVAEYSKWVRRMCRWCYDQRIEPETVTALQLRRWADTVPDSWASRKQARAAIGHWCEWLGRDDQPQDAIPVPRKPRHRSDALAHDSATRLRDGALLIGGRKGTATLLGLYTAARRNEIAGMRWDGWRDGHLTWRRTKVHDTHRVPVHPVLAGQLARWREQATSEFLFPGDRGRPHVSPTTVWGWVRDVGRACGVDVTTKQLRSTCLTEALDATKDLRAVQELAGHRDPAVTAGYTRLSANRLQATVDALDY